VTRTASAEGTSIKGGESLTATAVCLAGEQVVSGGFMVVTAKPQDEKKLLLSNSAPDGATGWTSEVTATAQVSQATLIAIVRCAI
jgi:hypothetical protein